MLIQEDKFIIRTPHQSDYPSFLTLYKKHKVMQYIPNSNLDWSIEKIEQKILKFNHDGIGINTVQALDGHFIGEASIFIYPEKPKSYEVGFILDDSAWGKGYGTLICKSLLQYCKETLHADRVYARMFSENIASQKVCLNNGMVHIDESLINGNMKRVTMLVTF